MTQVSFVNYDGGRMDVPWNMAEKMLALKGRRMLAWMGLTSKMLKIAPP